MQFNSKKYITSVDQFSNACITKQRRMSSILVSVLLEKRKDVASILTTQGGIQKAVTDVIEKDVAKGGGTVGRGTLVQTWQSVMNGYDNGLPTGTPGLYKNESGEWEYDEDIINANIEGIIAGRIRVGSHVPPSPSPANTRPTADSVMKYVEKKAEKTTKKERTKMVEAFIAKFS